jgi:hypothetical protein
LAEKAWPHSITEQLEIMADRLLSGDFNEVAQIAGKMIDGK